MLTSRYSKLAIVAWVSHALAQSFQYITNSSLPAGNLTDDCAAALMVNISCSPWVSRFRPGQYYDPKGLQAVCTSACQSGIQHYESNLKTACSASTYNYTDNVLFPISAIGSRLSYNYQLTCMKDNDRFCNYLAYEKSLQDNPDARTILGQSTSNESISDCDICFVKQWQLEAGSPFDGGKDAASEYSSYASSCKITSMPLTTTTISSSTSSTAVTATACAGSTYSVKPGDTCQSVSQSQNISVGWLISDNPSQLSAYCTNLTTLNRPLCIQNTCKIHPVVKNETCVSIARANNITFVQLLTWNPVLNPSCSNIGLSVNDTLCVGKPGAPYTTQTAPPAAATSFSTAAPVPTDVAANTTHYCGEYYEVQPNDYCNLLSVRFSLSLDDLIFLNPALNANCTNLFKGESYCVAPVGDINNYPGHAGAITTTTYAPSAYTAFPTATFVFPTLNISDPLPLADRTRTDCSIYVDGTSLQQNITGTIYTSTCQLYINSYGITTAQLQNWNPSLQTNSTTCAFESTVRYCMSAYDSSETNSPLAEPETTFPLRDGTLTNCTDYTVALPPSTCSDILTDNNITYAQFAAWNPSVEPNCQGLWLDYSYCVSMTNYTGSGDDNSTSGSTSITAAPTSGTQSSSTIPTSATPPGPTQSGQPNDCVAWYVAQKGDTCETVEKEYKISDEQFHEWNPAVSSDCASGFWANEAYCVGVSDDNPGTVSATTTASPTSTSSTAAIPSPTQANSIAANCNKYAQAPSGSYCSLFAQNNNISEGDLYAWNTVLGENGASCNNEFWSGYFYCIGVSS